MTNRKNLIRRWWSWSFAKNVVLGCPICKRPAIQNICKNCHTPRSCLQEAGQGDVDPDHLQKLSYGTVLFARGQPRRWWSGSFAKIVVPDWPICMRPAESFAKIVILDRLISNRPAKDMITRIICKNVVLDRPICQRLTKEMMIWIIYKIVILDSPISNRPAKRMMVRIICKNCRSGLSYPPEADQGDDNSYHLQKLSYRTVLFVTGRPRRWWSGTFAKIVILNYPFCNKPAQEKMIQIICKNCLTVPSLSQTAGSADDNLNHLQKLTTWTILFVTSWCRSYAKNDTMK